MAVVEACAAASDPGGSAHLYADHADGRELSAGDNGAIELGSRCLARADAGCSARHHIGAVDDLRTCSCDNLCARPGDRGGACADVCRACGMRSLRDNAASYQLRTADVPHELVQSANDDLSPCRGRRSCDRLADQRGGSLHDQRVASAARSEHFVGRTVASDVGSTDGGRLHAGHDRGLSGRARDELCSAADDPGDQPGRHAVRARSCRDAVCSRADGDELRTANDGCSCATNGTCTERAQHYSAKHYITQHHTAGHISANRD